MSQSQSDNKPSRASSGGSGPLALPINSSAAPPILSTSKRILDKIRAPVAEFFGLAIFVFFGASSDCLTVLSTSASAPKGDWLSLSFGWAVGLSLAVWVSAGISGGHVNPAMTVALATWKGFSWKKVPVYIIAQVLGGVVGAGLAYSEYRDAIDLFEGGRNIRTAATAGLFASFPAPQLSAFSAFFDEFLGTLLIGFVVMATTDKRNAAPPLNLLPLVIFVLMLGLAVGIGTLTAFAFNPARDFGPRLFLTMAGYGKILYTHHSSYWIWGGILAPMLGAQVGVGLYTVLLYRAPEEAHNDREDDNLNV